MPATQTSRVCAALLDAVAARGGDAAGAGAAAAYDAAAPPAMPLCDYLTRWNQYTETGDEEVVCAVVYIDRVCTRTGLVLTRRNVHRVVLAALLAATKWREERPFKMSHYARVGGVAPAELAALEERWIGDIDWRLGVDAPTVRKYQDKFRRHPAWCPKAAAPAPRGASRQQQHEANAAVRG